MRTLLIMLLLASSASAGNYNFLWQFGLSDYPPPVPSPATLRFGFEDSNGVLAPLVLTVPGVTPTAFWNGKQWSNDTGEKWFYFNSRNASSYGLDWQAFAQAAVSDDYNRVFLSLGDLRYESPHASTNIVNYLGNQLQLRLLYFGAPEGISLPPFVHAIRVEALLLGTGDLGPSPPQIAEPLTLLPLTIAALAALNARFRKTEAMHA